MTLFPRGTANDGAVTMGTSKKINKFMETFQKGKTIPILFPLIEGLKGQDVSILYHLLSGGFSKEFFKKAERTKGKSSNPFTKIFPLAPYIWHLIFAIIHGTRPEVVFNLKITIKKDGQIVHVHEGASTIYGVAILPTIGKIGRIQGCEFGFDSEKPNSVVILDVQPLEGNTRSQVWQRRHFIIKLFGTAVRQFFGDMRPPSDALVKKSREISKVEEIVVEGTPDTEIIIEALDEKEVVVFGDVLERDLNKPLRILFPDDSNAILLVDENSPLNKEFITVKIEPEIKGFEDIRNKLMRTTIKQGGVNLIPGKERDKIIERLELLQKTAKTKEQQQRIAHLLGDFKRIFFNIHYNVTWMRPSRCGVFNEKN